jgi:hypothetical protein
MILKFVKQLKLEEATAIRKAFQEVLLFNEAASAKFLAKDMLEKEESFPIICPKKDFSSCDLLSIPLKTHRSPLDQISTMPKGEMACRMQKFSTNEKTAKLSLKLFDNGKPHFEFKISTFDTAYENSFVWDILPFEVGLDISLRTLVGYFCNRYPLYQDVYKNLEENKGTLSEKLGEAFATDLLNLFSAKKPVPFIFKVPEASVDKELIVHISDKKVLLVKGLYLGDMLFPNTCLKENASYTLNNNNELLIFLYTRDQNLFKTFPVVSDKNLDQIKNLPALNHDMAAVANIWLENYITYGNFCAEIYRNIRPKVLLNNL